MRARSVVASAGVASVRSRNTCHRMAGSESSIHSISAPSSAMHVPSESLYLTWWQRPTQNSGRRGVVGRTVLGRPAQPDRTTPRQDDHPGAWVRGGAVVVALAGL